VPDAPPRPILLARLEALHAEIDDAVRPLVALHGARLRCRLGCTRCCVDDLTIFEVEADRIRARAASVLDEAPRPAGACAFLGDDGACRIYAHRPYVCRTQGLPLRWFEDPPDAAPGTELRDICPLNEPDGPPIETLPAAACWTIGPTEARLAALAAERDGATPRRVRLRDLVGPAR
jgi:hypothetical protein